MKNILKRLTKGLALIAAVGLLASLAPVQSFARSANEKDINNREVILPQYAGARVCRVDNTTTSKQCASGSGLLYAICGYGTTSVAGKGSMAFDTVTAADIANFGSLLAISPIVYATANTAASGNDMRTAQCWIPPVPARYESGLAAKQDDAGHDTLLLFRPDSGVNP